MQLQLTFSFCFETRKYWRIPSNSSCPRPFPLIKKFPFQFCTSHNTVHVGCLSPLFSQKTSVECTKNSVPSFPQFLREQEWRRIWGCQFEQIQKNVGKNNYLQGRQDSSFLDSAGKIGAASDARPHDLWETRNRKYVTVILLRPSQVRYGPLSALSLFLLLTKKKKNYICTSGTHAQKKPLIWGHPSSTLACPL